MEALPVVKDKTIDGPIYRNIYESIRSSILNGTIAGGAKLPATRVLSDEYGVSRMTVVNAYEQLIAEGYLVGKIGSGTFVAPTLPEHFLNTAKVLSEASGMIARRSFSAVGSHLNERAESILKNEDETKYKPFQHGLASIDDFPFAIWQRMTAKAAQISFRKLIGESGALGYMPLREAVAAHLRGSRGVSAKAEHTIITNGAQQALDLVARLFLGQGDVVWMDDPGYLGARTAFETAGANILPVGRDADGFDLNFAVKHHRPAKLIYTTPSHQFPVGGSMSIGRRLELLEWADKNDALIIEDDYDSEFRYEGRPLASMQGLDHNGRVIYIGTFSKTIFSALRLGCAVVPPDTVKLFQTARSVVDGHSSLMDQFVLANFISEGHFGRHLRRMRKLYADRQKAFLRLAGKYLSGIEFGPAASGMHLVGWLPKGVSDKAISKAAAALGVRVAPLSEYAIAETGRGGLLFGYAGFNEEQMAAAIKLLADLKF